MTYANPVERFRPAWWFGGLLLLIVFAEHTVTQQPQFRQHPLLPWGVTFDLLVLVPGLFYFIVVRRYGWPVTAVAGAVGAGLALASWLIPVAQQQPLQALRLLPMLLEAVTVVVLVAKARRLVRAYRLAGAGGFGPRARTAVQQTLGPAGKLLIFETDMLRYALLGWWAAPECGAGEAAFGSHRTSGFPALAVVGCLGLLVETLTVHLLANQWSHILAQWLLCFDGYGLLVWMAHGHAVRLRPSLLTAEELIVRVGFFWEAKVPRAALVAVEPLRDAPARGADTLNLSKLLFTVPNLLLTFAEPVAVTGPYGIRRTARRVAVYLDEPRQFTAAAGFITHSPTR